MVDLFEEVDEGLRSDNAASFIRRVAPWVIGVLVVFVVAYLGYWAYTAWQQRNVATASVAYEKGVDALAQGDQAGALSSFKTAETAGAPGYKMLALLQEGDIRLAAGKPDEAAKLYDQAADIAPNQVFGDLARLKAADSLIDTAPYAQLKTRLAPLADPKRPFAPYAKEALAMAELAAGKTADAKRDCDALQLSLDASQDMRQRCQIVSALIDRGEAQIAVAGAKAAATLPPPPPLSLGAPQLGPGGAGPAPSSPAGAAQ